MPCATELSYGTLRSECDMPDQAAALRQRAESAGPTAPPERSGRFFRWLVVCSLARFVANFVRLAKTAREKLHVHLGSTAQLQAVCVRYRRHLRPEFMKNASFGCVVPKMIFGRNSSE